MKTKFSNHEAVRLQFMTQSVNSLLSGENCLKQRKSTYDKRFIRYHKCFLLKLRYGAHANAIEVLFLFIKHMVNVDVFVVEVTHSVCADGDHRAAV